MALAQPKHFNKVNFPKYNFSYLKKLNKQSGRGIPKIFCEDTLAITLYETFNNKLTNDKCVIKTFIVK
jgi:hypothetical protein